MEGLWVLDMLMALGTYLLAPLCKAWMVWKWVNKDPPDVFTIED